MGVDSNRSDEEKKTASLRTRAVPYVIAVAVGIAVYGYLSRDKAETSTPTATQSAKTNPKPLEVTLNQYSGLDRQLEIDSCRRETERVAKCLMRKTKAYDGLVIADLRAYASKWDAARQQIVDLPPALLNGQFVGTSLSEVTIVVPEGTQFVTIGR